MCLCIKQTITLWNICILFISLKNFLHSTSKRDLITLIFADILYFWIYQIYICLFVQILILLIITLLENFSLKVKKITNLHDILSSTPSPTSSFVSWFLARPVLNPTETSHITTTTNIRQEREEIRLSMVTSVVECTLALPCLFYTGIFKCTGQDVRLTCHHGGGFLALPCQRQGRTGGGGVVST